VSSGSCRLLRRRLIPSGHVLFKEGDPGNLAYLIEQGRISVLKAGCGGDTIHVAQLGPGEIVGEMALIDGHPRCASAIATEATTLSAISKADLEKLMADSAPGLVGILKTLIARLRGQRNYT